MQLGDVQPRGGRSQAGSYLASSRYPAGEVLAQQLEKSHMPLHGQTNNVEHAGDLFHETSGFVAAKQYAVATTRKEYNTVTFQLLHESVGTLHSITGKHLKPLN